MPDGRPGDKPPASEESGGTVATGRSTFGRYQAFASLGSGGMADVFLAIARGPKGFNKLVVIKSLKKELSAEPFVDMFLDEARLAARLNHPNVVLTHEVDDSDGAYFIAMEYLEGQSLNKIIDRIRKNGEKLEPAVAVRLVSNALTGLHYAHELRDYDGRPLEIIHRDISPHNLFVTYEGQVKVVDFGIAKAISSSTQTEVGVLKGKVAYMAPEQALGDAVDRRADLYAMGIVLWEALTLTSFSKDESTAGRLVRLLNDGVPRVASIVPDIDPELDALVAKSLEKDPDKRFQTAAEMRDALEAWIAKAGATVRQEDIGRRISTMFQSVRSEVERKIRAQMDNVSADTKIEDLSTLNLGGGSSGSGSGSGSGRSRVHTATGASNTATAASNFGVTASPKAPSKRTIGIAVAAVAALAALGGWQWSISRSAALSASAVAAAPSSSAAVASSVIDEGRTESFGPLPNLVSSPANPLSDEKIALGRMLYYDTRLSKNQDVSCNSCHLLEAYGVDGKPVSTGHAQQAGTRNSPTVYNSAGYFALMWDGRFPDVEEQAKGPLQNPVEMAMTPKRVEETLQSMPEYVEAFAKAFPGHKSAASAVTFDNAARAIGAFERKLFTPSRWEKYLAGEKSALTDAEKIGFNTFVETGCPTCHYGPYVGATMFQKLGLVKAWPYIRDRGKYEITQKNEDYMVFRVPSLRNVAKTAPYLHNGSLTQLSEVVRMMARHQIGKELSDAQANAIVTWLGALTGDLPTDYIKKPELPPNGKKTPAPEL